MFKAFGQGNERQTNRERRKKEFSGVRMKRGILSKDDTTRRLLYEGGGGSLMGGISTRGGDRDVTDAEADSHMTDAS